MSDYHKPSAIQSELDFVVIVNNIEQKQSA